MVIISYSKEVQIIIDMAKYWHQRPAFILGQTYNFIHDLENLALLLEQKVFKLKN